MTKRLAQIFGSGLVLAAMLSLSFSLQFQPAKADFQDCAGRLTPDDLRQCQDAARRVAPGSSTFQLPGGWRLVRTSDPRGGPDAVSILHTADTQKSDFNFAGLTFRCGPTGIETLLILLEPLVRGSQYDVRAKSGSTETPFEARAVQAGEALLLPPNATALAGGPWQAIPELGVDVAAPAPIHGSVPLSGLAGALQALSRNCPAH
jgi:hypothetical protein